MEQHDYWRGTLSGRNKDAGDDPFTLSNALPLPRRIYDKVRPQVDVYGESASARLPVGLVVDHPPVRAMGDLEAPPAVRPNAVQVGVEAVDDPAAVR